MTELTSVIAAVQGVLDNVDKYTEDKIIGAMEDDPILLKPGDCMGHATNIL